MAKKLAGKSYRVTVDIDIDDRGDVWIDNIDVIDVNDRRFAKEGGKEEFAVLKKTREALKDYLDQ